MRTPGFTSLLLFFVYFLTGITALNAQSVAINEYLNQDDPADEWVELVSLEEVDISGWYLINFNDQGQPTDTLRFSDHSVWQNMKPGTIILIQGANANLDVDTDPADGYLVLNAGDDTYFSGPAPSISGSSDGTVISDSAGNHIHGLGHGSASQGQLGSNSVHIGASIESGESVGFYATTQKSRLNNSLFAKIFSTPTPGAGNDSDQVSFYDDLRPLNTSNPIIQVLKDGSVLSEGDDLLFNRPIPGNEQTMTIGLTNLGDPTLEISDMTIEPSVFSVDPNEALQIPSGDTLSLEISFTPDGESSQYSGRLTLTTNDPDQPEYLLTFSSSNKLPPEDRFEAVTWNIEWFGSDFNGPEVQKQMENAMQIMDSLRADLYALQEISDQARLQSMADGLEGSYSSHYADNSGQSEAYIYNTETINSLSESLLQIDRYAWANGRYPHLFNFEVTLNNANQRVLAINIHAKAFDDEESYNRRKMAAEGLYDELQNEYPDTKIIFLGDYNDDVTESIYQGAESPYQVFVDDTSNYQIVTKPLSEDGQSSMTRYDNVIDHITISDELFEQYMEGSATIKNDVTDYIDNYGETTSDHYPVWAHFDFNTYTSIDEPIAGNELADRISLLPNYPNPFNPATTIAYRLPDAKTVSLDIYSVTGQHIANVIQEQSQSAGRHQIRVQANGWSSGVYVYRLSTSDGFQQTRTMTLIK